MLGVTKIPTATSHGSSPPAPAIHLGASASPLRPGVRRADALFGPCTAVHDRVGAQPTFTTPARTCLGHDGKPSIDTSQLWRARHGVPHQQQRHHQYRPALRAARRQDGAARSACCRDRGRPSTPRATRRVRPLRCRDSLQPAALDIDRREVRAGRAAHHAQTCCWILVTSRQRARSAVHAAWKWPPAPAEADLVRVPAPRSARRTVSRLRPRRATRGPRGPRTAQPTARTTIHGGLCESMRARNMLCTCARADPRTGRASYGPFARRASRTAVMPIARSSSKARPARAAARPHILGGVVRTEHVWKPPRLRHRGFRPWFPEG